MTPALDRPVDWEALVTENANRLYRTALALLKDRSEAEDAVQDAFLKYWEKRPQVESEAHQRAWLMRVLVNGCKTRLRSPWRTRHVELSDALPAASPEERQELEELMALPARDRLAIHLFYYEGYRTDEIARITGEREGTIRSRLSRARKKLRILLEQAES